MNDQMMLSAKGVALIKAFESCLAPVGGGKFKPYLCAHEFSKWNRGGGKVLAGLVRRRACEALLFQGIADLNYDGVPDAPMAHSIEANPSGIA